jgi:hypothetical protein
MYHGDVPPLGGDPVTRVGTARVDHAVTSGTFSLDGETFEVANNVWVAGDDAECVVIVGGQRNLPARGHQVASAVMTEGERSLGSFRLGSRPSCRCQPQVCRLET